LLTRVLRTIVAKKLLSQKWIFASNGLGTPIKWQKFAANDNSLEIDFEDLLQAGQVFT
jgi:hypothetical protein